jgi:hypothetical protein
MSDIRFDRVPLNGCSACCRDFASLKAFDVHRVGSQDYDFSLDRLDGRRCLDVEELSEWIQDGRGRWTTRTLKARADRLAQYHLEAALKPSEATEAA